jgi:hypothetical protein
MDLNSSMFMSLGDPGHFQSYGGDSQLLGLSLQEMIDTDIKAEFDDITCGGSGGPSFSNMDSLELLSDLDFKFEDGMLGSSSNCGWSASRSGLYDASMSSSSYLEDMTVAASVMVNPSSVMPLHHHAQQQLTAASAPSTSQVTSVVTVHSPVVVTQTQLNLSTSAALNRGVKTLKILPPMSSPMQQVHIS